MRNIKLRSYKDTGTILLGDGVITADRLKEATDAHQKTGLSVGRALVELGFITEWELARAVAKELGVSFIRLREMEYRSEGTLKLSPALLHHHRFFIFEHFDGVDTVVVTEPPTLDLLTEISSVLAEKVYFLVSLMSDVERALIMSVPLPQGAQVGSEGTTTAEEILKGFSD
jgi:Type II secretion system (T2SS), protein E, N-terminal domain